ncbi:PREDICTED: dehydrogenase/reductase SDR family member 7B [Dipodomys ordii]|uniref:Dehydrogenase/reductase SDR family member 7B n=1 Tax=Dipodomys ordii TaxID=10020 RepID=A0A1S3F563_DIPOR|nr:PREDICTED: dehydrogenase/reductase SDR family member 7B [Dipodomys ordii]
MVSFKSRRNLMRGRVMDWVTCPFLLPVMFSCMGIFGLLKLLQWIRMKAYVRNSVVVITGATSGLGKEAGSGLYHLCPPGSPRTLKSKDTELRSLLLRFTCCLVFDQGQTYKPSTVAFDLTDPPSIAAAASKILQSFGYVDILINNAGISYRGTIVDTKMDVDRKVMETNYFGPIALTKALLPSMIKRKKGHIVAISSIQGKYSIPFRSAYAASKHATQAFFDCLRAETEHDKIEVTVISPGYIHTNLSLNAITADGSKYGVMDKTTTQGQCPTMVARNVLVAVGKKRKDVILADLLPSWAIYLRTLVPELFFRIMASRAKKEQKTKTS